MAQSSQLPAPSPIEKELAARASDVTEVTLGKNMLAFAAKIMNGKDDGDAEARHLIEGLDGIYVRVYEFDKAGEPVFQTKQVKSDKDKESALAGGWTLGAIAPEKKDTAA